MIGQEPRPSYAGRTSGFARMGLAQPPRNRLARKWKDCCGSVFSYGLSEKRRKPKTMLEGTSDAPTNRLAKNTR